MWLHSLGRMSVDCFAVCSFCFQVSEFELAGVNYNGMASTPGGRDR